MSLPDSWGCPFCNMGTDGQHAHDCPNRPPGVADVEAVYSRPQQGWICPRCQTVNAPWNPTCDCPPKLIGANTDDFGI